MSKQINQKECPNCHSNNTKIIDIEYNQESYKCEDCSSIYQVYFKLIPYNIKLRYMSFTQQHRKNKLVDTSLFIFNNEFCNNNYNIHNILHNLFLNCHHK